MVFLATWLPFFFQHAWSVFNFSNSLQIWATSTKAPIMQVANAMLQKWFGMDMLPTLGAMTREAPCVLTLLCVVVFS